ncbi:MAG TPA: site-specific integrase, partial [Bryobacteraceae bacterium]
SALEWIAMRGHIRDYELKAGGKLWAAVVYQGKRVARNGTLRDSYQWIRGFRTQRAAQTELNKVLRAMDEGTYAEPSKQTVSEYLDRWLKTVEPNVGDKTFERYKQMVEVNINPKLGPILLTKLQPVQLAEFYIWSSVAGNRRTGAGLSTQTVLHIHRLLSHAFKQAVMWQLRPTNPASAVQAPRPVRKEVKAVEEDRSALLLVSAENTVLYLPILMGLCTGMRRGEILGLRWTDMDFENSRLTVNQALGQTRKYGLKFKPTKNKKSHRTIALPACLVAALMDHRANQDKIKKMFGPDYPKFDLVMPLADGTPWPPDDFTDAYIAFSRRICTRDIRFHDLRHTHASELLRRGVPLRTVSQRLGHANPTVTLNIYAHVMSGDDEKAADTTETMIKKQLEKKGAKKPE